MENKMSNLEAISPEELQQRLISARKKISFALNLGIVIAILISFLPIAKVIKTDKLIKDLSSAIKQSDYDLAQKLQEEIKSLGNEK